MADNKTKDKKSEDVKDGDNPDPKKRGLGRGLGALFEDEEGVYPQADLEGHTPGQQRKTVGIDQLEPGPYQPRKYIDHESIKELSESIAVHGVLQPLIVRAKNGFPDTYEIIAGERRWRASMQAKLHEVPVIIRELDDETVLEIALIENLQREDLNALEEAQGYAQLMEEFGHTQEKLAASLGKSRSYIANTVRLLKLPPGIHALIKQGKLSAGHARALITADNPDGLAKIIINQGLTVRETEALVADTPSKGKGNKPKKPKAHKDVNTLALEDDISNLLGMKATIDVKGKGGAGSLKIEFRNLDQLDEVLHRLRQNPGKHPFPDEFGE